MTILARNIRALRKRRGLTQKELADLSGLTAGALSSYEKGVTTPRRPALERLARALEVPVAHLEGEDPLPPAGTEALYGGVLALLRQLYGGVESRTVLGENGGARRYYIVRRGMESFVLHEGDVEALARSTAALAASLSRTRGVGA